MKKQGAFFPLTILLFVLCTSLTGCEAISGIFKAGFNTALVMVLLVIVIVVFIIFRLRGRKD